MRDEVYFEMDVNTVGTILIVQSKARTFGFPFQFLCRVLGHHILERVIIAEICLLNLEAHQGHSYLLFRSPFPISPKISMCISIIHYHRTLVLIERNQDAQHPSTE